MTDDDDDDDVLSRRCFSLVFLPVPQAFLLVPLLLFIYLRSLSVRTFILNLFLPRTENANQNKSKQIFVFRCLFTCYYNQKMQKNIKIYTVRVLIRIIQ